MLSNILSPLYLIRVECKYIIFPTLIYNHNYSLYLIRVECKWTLGKVERMG